MASVSTPAQSMNSASNNTIASNQSQKDGSGRSVKQTSSNGSKMTHKGRKESPSNANRQSSTTPKAWSGPNPITQRATTPNQAKASQSQQSKTPSSATRMSNSKDATLSETHSYDRLRYIMSGSLGLQVVLTTTAGDKYEGLFAGYSNGAGGAEVHLRMTKSVPHHPITQPNGMHSVEAAFTGSSPDYAMVFALRDMADMTIPEFSIPQASKQTNGVSSSFQTDVDISGNANRGERTLQRWVPDAHDGTDFSLESGSAAGWDQFATHQKMTGGQSTYTEEQYTTTIDRSAPDYKRREAEAARIAREIESETSLNPHLREERGQAVENDFGGDEEEKYSGVRRDFQALGTGKANRYTPPALRAPSAQAAASGAPVDPAIISSQLARPGGSRTGVPPQPVSADKTAAQARTVSAVQNAAAGEPAPIERNVDVSALVANGAAVKAAISQKAPANGTQRSSDNEAASQGVENKVLDHFRQFATAERARIAEKKRVQANQDRTAKINDLVRFSKTFKLKTPVPQDLVGILAKDPKKQDEIVSKARKDHEDAKSPSTTPTAAPASGSSTVLPPPNTKFDKSQIPPPIPDRQSLAAGRAGYSKNASLGRGTRPQIPFSGATVPAGPRGANIKTGQAPTPIPMPELKNQISSGLSSPRGTDTPTSAVSSKFNVKALEFRPTAPSFNPSNASVSAASPSPIARTASIARTATPSTFFSQRKSKKFSEKLDMADNFNPIPAMQAHVKAEAAKHTEGPVLDYKANGGVPFAFKTAPTWVLPNEENQEKKAWDDSFTNNSSVSPAPMRMGPPSHGPMQPVMMPMMGQNMGGPHGHHAGQHYQQTYEEQRLHMQNGTPQAYTPNMTPRSQFVSPMPHPSQPAYGQQGYYMGGRNMPMQGYGAPTMMHGQHGQPIAPMMVAQHSNSPYMNMQGQPGMMYSPGPGHSYPQHVQNGYPSPGRQMQAPAMMHQGSQHSYHGAPQMVYGQGPMYQPQGQMRGNFAGGHTPYGTSPHQPQNMNQRAMSSEYMQKGMPANGGPPANAPQQPAAYNQPAGIEEAK